MTLILTISLCLITSFILSGLESALLSISPARLHQQAGRGQNKALRLERLLPRQQQLLISILLINAAINLVAFALVTRLTVDSFGRWGYLIAFLLSLPVYLIWIELLPKSIFKNLSHKALLRFLPILLLIDGITRPFIYASRPFIKLVSGKSNNNKQLPANAARDELRVLTDILDREGVFSSGEKNMIHRVLDFQSLSVNEVMLPLSRVTAVPLEMPITSVLNLARETDISQFPVISSKGELVGLVDVLELLNAAVSQGSVKNYLRKLVETSPDARAIDVLRRLRRAGLSVAAVHNEKKRPLGIVSVDDMISHLIKFSPHSA